MKPHRPKTGVVDILTAKVGTREGDANTIAQINDVIRPRLVRGYCFVKKGSPRSIFRYF